ncbi:EI24 domain-containing protein [Nocardiopsis aegyptia]|uniref:CysZ protein n=1 Tax=Nocardiopsis aegyptia TaxID=220378 RepID=A0A7Z0ELK9_9ACTN|nr:EI24 domain-containing protein [Nocardiopsis aegyptia]NYJ34122.1 CysZ protein [Nocardiopsis aegyptia]
MATFFREIFGGVGALARGFVLLLRKPRLFLLGAVPPLITSLLFLALFVALVLNVEDFATWATPFSEGWDPVWRGLVRGAVAVGTVVGSVLLMVVTFTTITLTLGSPIYDKIGELVEKELGNAPEPHEEPLAASIARAIRQSLVIVFASLLVTVVVFAIGFVPLAGQVVGAVLAAVLGGWLLGIELVGGAFDRRAMLRLRDRQRFLRTRRLRTLGFSVPTYFLLAIPFVAVAVFPAAAAGGTILARQLFDANPELMPAPRPPQGPRVPPGAHGPQSSLGQHGPQVPGPPPPHQYPPYPQHP